jgi:hypothetical protein
MDIWDQDNRSKKISNTQAYPIKHHIVVGILQLCPCGFIERLYKKMIGHIPTETSSQVIRKICFGKMHIPNGAGIENPENKPHTTDNKPI